jgi:DNA-binding MarR family transcriptional regulator
MNKITHSRAKRSRKADFPEADEQPISHSEGGAAGTWPALRNLSYRINFIHRLFDRQTKKYLSEHYDMTNAEWYVLGYLAWHSPRTIAAISSESAIYKSQVSHAVTILVEKGLVLRADDPSDKRSPQFRISARGKRLQEKISIWSVERQKQLSAQLAPHQYKALDEALNILAAYVKTTS